MSYVLPDGTVVPAHITVGNTEQRGAPASNAITKMVYLREGFVVRRHIPGEPGYQNAPFITYDVACYQTDGLGAEHWPVYNQCRVAVPVGGGAVDQFHSSVRCPSGFNGTVTPEIASNSTRVLVQCIDGLANRAVIVGYMRHDESFQDVRENGHHRYESFNGMQFVVNKDGEYIVLFTGATIDFDSNKVSAPAEGAGTYLKFTKEGNLVLDDADGESITIDKKNKTITVNARAETDNIQHGWTVNVGGDATIKAAGTAQVDGSNVVLGNSDLEALAKGQQLIQALTELVDAFATGPIGGLGQPFGAPVFLHGGGLGPKILAWRAKWLNPLSPMLSKKSSTE